VNGRWIFAFIEAARRAKSPTIGKMVDPNLENLRPRT